jgi:cytochrome c biogenesis protein CcmG/thiol:disulfide interchange protein DsbE
VKRWIVWLPLGALAGLGALFALFSLRNDPHYEPTALVGKPLPVIALATLNGDGTPVSLKATIQGPTFVNLWASWCVPCIQETPTLNAMKATGARIIGIASRDAPDDSRAFLAKYGDPFAEVLVDRDGRASVELGVTAYPETYLVDGGGTIVAKHVGPMTAADAEAMMEKIKSPIR